MIDRGYRRLVELRQLRCFVAVAEEQHFGRAASRLGIGQPAASQLIARLERELRIPLFARTSRRVALTPEGTEFLVHARTVLDVAETASAAARRLARSPRRLLVVGTCSGLGDRLPTILAELAEREPELEVRLHSVPARERAQRRRDQVCTTVAAYARLGARSHPHLSHVWRRGPRYSSVGSSPRSQFWLSGFKSRARNHLDLRSSSCCTRHADLNACDSVGGSQPLTNQ